MTDDRFRPFNDSIPVILEAPTEHTYPSHYQLGTHWATDAAWEVLDFISPGVIDCEVRAVLAALIAKRLMKERERPTRDKSGYRG